MTNKEFLFIFDAALSNPNGDPDQENKPRMDRATKTNLVSDTRLKRNIRDYLIKKFDSNNTENDVFVRMLGENKVSVETRLLGVVMEILQDNNRLELLKNKHATIAEAFSRLREAKSKSKEDNDSTKPDRKKQAESFKGSDYELYHSYIKNKELKEFIISKEAKPLGEVHNELLLAIIKNRMIDIRFFGGAFAVGGFSRTITGPIQINFGYSLHPVELSDSNTTVTIMSGTTEGESNIGKKEKLKYSLIGYTGTINAKRGAIVGLKENEKFQQKNGRNNVENTETKESQNEKTEKDDLELFRESCILSLLSNDSDSKKNQYPRLYLEIDYNENEIYGRLGDLRNLVDVTSKIGEDKEDFSKVRSIDDVNIDLSRLMEGIEIIKHRIKIIRVWEGIGFNKQICINNNVSNKDLPETNADISLGQNSHNSNNEESNSTNKETDKHNNEHNIEEDINWEKENSQLIKKLGQIIGESKIKKLNV